MPLFSTLKTTVTAAGGNEDYYFRGRADAYTEIGTETGVALAPLAERNHPLTKVEELVAKGILIRLAASTGLPSSTARKTVRLVCSRSKLVIAMDNLPGKDIRGRAIFSVRVPQKAVYS